MSLLRSSQPAPAPWGDRLRSVLRAATTPVLPEDYLDLVVPLRSGADLRGRIVEVRPETARSATIVIRPGRDWKQHRPGQYVRVGVDVDGVRRWRAYSLTSAVDAPLISITVKQIADGLVSTHLVTRSRPGQLIHLDQPTGDFVLPDPTPSKVLFVTAGSGLTPVMGMLRNHLGHEGSLDDVVLVHCDPTGADILFADELGRLGRDNRLRLVLRLTEPDGLLRPEELVELVPDLAERQAWVCGPTGLLDAVEQWYADHAWGDQLHTERFRPTVLAGGEGGEVRFGPDQTATTVEAAGDRPILDVGEEAGVLMPSGCRMGICFGCVLPLREGAVRDLRTGEITTASPGDGVSVQTCISAAAGPCRIDVP